MTSYAFIVGINDYQNLPHLMGAVNDANAFYDWLLDTGEVPTENIFRITSANNALLPTIDNIERELKNTHYFLVIDYIFFYLVMVLM